MKKILKYLNYQTDSQTTKDFALLFLRLIIAYGFWSPAIMKLQGLSGTADWFASMGYPVPMLSALLAAVTEISGVFLLIAGFGTRFIAIPLMFVMLVAIFSVHISNGFAAGDNGFEIPLYYMLMLFTLLAGGPGRLSLDHLFFFRKK